MNATTIGIDIAKSVFQVHGVDAAGKVTLTKKLRRAEVIRFFEAIPGRGGDLGDPPGPNQHLGVGVMDQLTARAPARPGRHRRHGTRTPGSPGPC